MEYGDVIWNNCNDCDSALLDGVQYEAARLVTGAIKELVLQGYTRSLLGSLLVTEGNYTFYANFTKL